ncbi:ATP-binding protein [Actinopolymorpha pittospori]|uniref:Non-specific serine/threonine protein kinase n=1 Tax=Actinopolymorpha pittospori TaxID=648752 RepID=A0A927MTP1_9ACTN|nr:LuxR C-terminal-related transcriptional regulator [Actinopolymorpha pittospori]MBE1606127.1 non-specific serine/threonine protein kinase [Actinopolymorpha pittospori]
MSRVVPNAASPRAGNLPVEATSFVGRRREVADVKRLVAGTRMVTLTGFGGVGKSRLALRASAGVHRAFRDGVWLVDLATLPDPRRLTETILDTFGVADHASTDPESRLADHLRDRQLLLVLDNCEHLAPEVGALAERLLREAPGLHVLATSRQRLNVATEHTLSVSPLPVPGAAAGTVGSQPHLLARFESVVLFAERATAVQHDFTLNDENRDAVVEICRRLDGLPLGIELAAARLRTLTPAQILARLDDWDRLLTTGPDTAAPRHRTLAALLDWSFDLCSPAERVLWARSAVFAGSFDLAAAEAVCSGDGIAAEDVMDLVTGLLDKSVLHREEHHGIARYRQLGLIRQYGLRRLAERDEASRLRGRHADYYVDLVSRTARVAFGSHQVEWLHGLELDQADLRAALDFASTERLDGAAGLRLATGLLYHWINTASVNEGRQWLGRMLAMEPAATLSRAQALWVAAWLATIQADFEPAASLLAETRSLGERLDAPSLLGYVALLSGLIETSTGDATTGLAHYEEALDRLRELNDQHGVAAALIRLSLTHSALHDDGPAVAAAEEALAVCERSGDVWHRSYALLALGIQRWRQGDTDQATEWELESLRINQGLGDRLGIALNLEVLALAAATEHDHVRAAHLLGAQLSLGRSLGLAPGDYTHLTAYKDDLVDQVRGAMGEHAYQAALGDGSALNLEQTLALALRDERSRSPAVRDADSSPLTRREREIAELVAEGRSNKEIARRLVIAQRTAESHVENILVKLGFTSRAQIAAWASEQGRPVSAARP